ncbi:hypothetical protein PIB30_018027 [Stylosanthes scabra]|uniref:Reverse transcriptase zinc-binding domain-containing protein n=1 Tax=Stylosanthes scabra TaxID=79078 RepID=A0ABU6W5W1_9FABA|nr:hypothetical protein [Stylosanthes scabra]
MTPPPHHLEDDKIGWGLSEDGNYSVGATYKAISNWPKPSNTVWCHIWSWKGPQKAKVFMCTLLHKRVLTNQRKARIFGGTGDCNYCQGTQEDLIQRLPKSFNSLDAFPKT